MNQNELDKRYANLEVDPLSDRVRLLLRILAGIIKIPSVVMDVGCGAGSITKHFHKIKWVRRVIGIDAGREALDIASQHCDLVIWSNLEKRIELPGECTDVVVSSYVMEHITNTETYLREMYRVLRPGGYLVLQVVNLACWCNRLALLIGWQPWFTETGTEANYGNPVRGGADGIAGHVRYHVPGAFRAMLKATGYQIEAQYGFSELSRLKWLDRLISRLWVGGATGLVYVCRK
jgi:SAM-dependent methyltransferase